NLWTLGVVSLFRVALMIRVLVVLFGYHPWNAVWVVLLFADTVALLALRFVPVPLIDVMGGIRLSESDRLLKETACAVLQFGGCSYIFWLIAGIGALAMSQLRWQADTSPEARTLCPAVSLWGLALASLGIWAFILPLSQPEQQLRSRVESLYA